MHFAPELGLSRKLQAAAGRANYSAHDIVPKQLPHCDVTAFDLCSDVEALQPESVDLIVHSHVLEHVPCNYSAVMQYLHRARTPTGCQVCIVPFVPGPFEEDLGAASDEDRTRRFGQSDHMRRFGAESVRETLGMVFDLPDVYDIEARFGAAVLDEHGIPNFARRGFNPNTVLVLRKEDRKI